MSFTEVDQKCIVLLLLHQSLAGTARRGLLLRALGSIEMTDLDALIVENVAILARVLRWNVVAVVHDALLIDPAIGDALVRILRGVRARCGPGGGAGRCRCEQQENSEARCDEHMFYILTGERALARSVDTITLPIDA
jgi:hypothetical protein